MNPAHPNTDAEMIALLERLACGELDRAGRERVLAWLEEDPRRWRVCGLAFLEAQSWSEALIDWPQLPAAKRTPVAPTPPVRRRTLAALVSAACLLLAFGMGVAWQDIAGRPSSPYRAVTNAQDSNAQDNSALDNVTSVAAQNASDPDSMMLASLSVRQGSALEAAGSIQVPVVPRDTSLEADRGALDEIPAYIRSQWERRGFKLTSERRYLFAHLSNGQPIVVPVEQVVVNSVPQQIH